MAIKKVKTKTTKIFEMKSSDIKTLPRYVFVDDEETDKESKITVLLIAIDPNPAAKYPYLCIPFGDIPRYFDETQKNYLVEPVKKIYEIDKTHVERFTEITKNLPVQQIELILNYALHILSKNSGD
jgi:hypothetical protein